MLENVYWYQIKGRGAVGVVQAVSEAIVLFEKRFGHAPKFVRMRKDEHDGLKFPIKCVLVKNGMAPGHFALYPVILRMPVVYDGERRPI